MSYDILSCKFLFFFSSRRRHTRLQGDWSSDVCSSDLDGRPHGAPVHTNAAGTRRRTRARHASLRSRVRYVGPRALGRSRTGPSRGGHRWRSEERRVGKEGREGREAEWEEKQGEGGVWC